MKFLLSVSILLTAVLSAAATSVSFTTPGKNVITIIPEKNTGLDAVFVTYTCKGLTISIKTDRPNVTPEVYRFGALGGGYAEIYSDFTFSAGTVKMTDPTGDSGYIIEQGDSRYYFWLTDYSAHLQSLYGMSVSPESDCTSTLLDISASSDAIRYYSISGRPLVLSRGLKLTYNTLEWDEENMMFAQKEETMTLEFLSQQCAVTPPPYCDTYFTLTGDRFLEEWNEGMEIESEYWHTNAVEVHTSANQTFSDSDHSNQIGSADQSALGGSAPAQILFNSYLSDGVVHTEWQISTDSEFENIIHRFNEQDLDYEFRDEGTWFVRFIGSNADGSCESEGDIYTVSIGASELVCPNAFSPGASEGVNDEWKVSYKSIVEFKCWIFDRYGTQLYYFDSPDGGWDGKYRGKLVKPGVYYYVIEAKGAEGKKYKKSGDINILRYKSYSGTSVTEPE